MQHKIATRLVLGMVALWLLVSPFFVLTPSAYGADFGLKAAAKAGKLYTDNKTTEGTAEGVQQVIGQLIGTVLSFVGVIFLVLMIYGGFMWMMGGKEGKEKEIDSAKKIITSSLIGLVIIFGAYLITAFVTGQLGTAFGI